MQKLKMQKYQLMKFNQFGKKLLAKWISLKEMNVKDKIFFWKKKFKWSLIILLKLEISMIMHFWVFLNKLKLIPLPKFKVKPSLK
jgi:hypothetical protein